MKIIFSFSFVALMTLVFTSSTLSAQHVYDREEIELSALESYNHPIRDVRVRCAFVGALGDTLWQDAFWDGENSYKVRFSAPYGGAWSWWTESTNADDAGLHMVAGTFEPTRKSGEGFFDQEGWLEVSGDRHFLEYESDRPFFWLACTAWEIVWKSTHDQMEAYLDDRQEKEFTAIQIVVFSHQRIHEYGVENRNGATSFLDEDRSKYNPEYFRYLDTIVSMVNERDMVAVMVPMWAAFSELYKPSGHRFYYDYEEAMHLARYVGARYAGHNVTWIAGGDNYYDTEERRDLFRDFTLNMQEAGAEDQLVSIHPKGWSSSIDYFDNNVTWLDFHMYQSSHTAYGDYTWDAAWKGYWREPAMPILNSEATYEDIYHNLWEPGDTAHPNTFRISAAHVRQASYESVLSGSLVGITYGANGVWQWHTPEVGGSHDPRLFVEEAWEMPGSTDMMILKRIMQRVRWHSLVPNKDILRSKETFEDEYVAIAENDQAIVAYLPPNTTSITLNRNLLPDTFCYSFVSPDSGEFRPCIQLDLIPGAETVQIFPPDTLDWVLIIDKVGLTDIVEESDFDEIQVDLRPNPILGHGSLFVSAHRSSDISISIYALNGTEVQSYSQSGIASLRYDVRNLEEGAYLYRVTVSGQSDEPAYRFGRMLIVSGQ